MTVWRTEAVIPLCLPGPGDEDMARPNVESTLTPQSTSSLFFFFLLLQETMFYDALKT